MKRFKLLSAFLALSALLVSCSGNVDPENKEKNEIVQGEKITSIYQQKMVAMQFTSVGCVNCPSLSATIKSIKEKQP